MNNADLTPPVDEQDHTQGPSSAPVTLVEFGDYQCPYCGTAYEAVKEIQERLGDRLRFVFRNLPLTESHAHALEAAEAAEAAGEQGKFWEMHDLLYENQRRLDRSHLEQYAQQLGLDTQRFSQALEGHAEIPRIQRDVDSANDSGVMGTPTFYINGRQYQGDFSTQDLLRAVEEQEPR